MDRHYESQTKPLIAISCDVEEEPSKMVLRESYLFALRAAGATPVPLPVLPDQHEMERMISLVDGFIFTGGDDLNPKHYGMTARDHVDLNSEKREKTDLKYMEAALDSKKPILGVCYGMQLLNVVRGGTLYQDIRNEIDHDVLSHKLPDQLTAHKVRIKSDSKISDVFSEEEITVNSSHHQSIRSVGEGLEAVAESPDGVIEGIESENKDRYLVGVQWHPERMVRKKQETELNEQRTAEKNALVLFQHFVDVCKRFHRN